MSKKVLMVLAAGLLATGLASAQSSAMKTGKHVVKPASRAEIISISKGEAPQGLWCDSLGYQWNLAGAGFSGGAIAVTGTAGICGDSPVAGTVTIAKGLPTDLLATVNPGCYCNSFHENILTWDKASGMFVGDAVAYGGCDGTAPITMGKC